MEYKISYDCEDVIEDIKQDIAEFGLDEKAYGVFLTQEYSEPFTGNKKSATFLVNYLLGTTPPSVEELEGGTAILSTLGNLLDILEEQNKI